MFMKKAKSDVDVAVVGGGAAGMLSAAVAAERGMRVALFEKNAFTGKKTAYYRQGPLQCYKQLPAGRGFGKCAYQQPVSV